MCVVYAYIVCGDDVSVLYEHVFNERVLSDSFTCSPYSHGMCASVVRVYTCIRFVTYACARMALTCMTRVPSTYTCGTYAYYTYVRRMGGARVPLVRMCTGGMHEWLTSVMHTRIIRTLSVSGCATRTRLVRMRVIHTNSYPCFTFT